MRNLFIMFQTIIIYSNLKFLVCIINFKLLFQNNFQTHHYTHKYHILLVMIKLNLKILESSSDRL